MLASIVGSVAAGQDTDRAGPVRAYLAAVGSFAAGSVLAALAGSWGVLLAGRVLEGLGAGALGVVTYASASRAYPAGDVRADAGADVVGLGAAVARRPGAWPGWSPTTRRWRWVFVLPAPVPARRGRADAAGPARARAGRAVAAGAAGGCRGARARRRASGCFLAALELRAAAVLLALAARRASRSPCWRCARCCRPGTLRAARGLPSGIAVRGLLAVAFLGCDAFMPLALTELRGFSSSQARARHQRGVAELEPRLVPAGRLDRRDARRGPAAPAARRARGAVAGIAVTAAGVLVDAVPVAVASRAGAWPASASGSATRRSARSCSPRRAGGEEGRVSAALQLAETVGVALFTGLGGALIALGLDRGWDAVTALALVFAAGAAAAAAGLLVGRARRPRAPA